MTTERIDVLAVMQKAEYDYLEDGFREAADAMGLARAAVAELIAARDEDAAMPIYVELNWIRDGDGEDGRDWWPRRRQELADQGYTITGEGSNGAEFFMRGCMTDRLVAALARVSGD